MPAIPYPPAPTRIKSPTINAKAFFIKTRHIANQPPVYVNANVPCGTFHPCNQGKRVLPSNMPKNKITRTKATASGLMQRGRNIDETVAKEMAKLVAKRITEAGAAMILGIKPTAWYVWKSRNKDKFSNLLMYVRESKINAMLDSIDEAGDGKVVETEDGPVVLARADWRAKSWLLERAIAPERFAKQPEQIAPAPAINVQILSSLAEQVFGKVTDAEVIAPKAIAQAGDGATSDAMAGGQGVDGTA